MGDVWIGNIEFTTFIAICSVLIVLPMQLLLCFKVKNSFIRLLPSILLTITTIILFCLMCSAEEWDAIGYALLGVFSGVMLIVAGIAWCIWVVVRAINKRKKEVGEHLYEDN